MLKTKQIISLLLVLLLVIMGLPVKSFANKSDKTYFVERATQYKNKTYIELYQEDGYSPMDGYIYEQNICIVNENNKKVDLGYEIYKDERVLDGNLLKIGSELYGDTYTIDMDTDNVSIKEFDESIYQTIEEEILEYYNIKDDGRISLDDLNIPGGWISYAISLEEDDIKYGFYKNGKIVETYTDLYYHVKEFNNGNVYMIIDKYINEGSYVPVLGILNDRGFHEYDINLSEEDVVEHICVSPDGEYIILLKFKSDGEEGYLTEPYSIKKYNSEKNIYEEYSKNIFKSEEYVVSYTIDNNNNLWFITNYNNKKYIKKLEGNKLVEKYKAPATMNDLDVYDDKNLIVWNHYSSTYPYQRIVDGRYIDEGFTGNDGENSDTIIDSSINYQSYISETGWQDWKYDGQLSGNKDSSKKLHGIKINLGNQIKSDLSVEYRTHISKVGWQDWKANGQLSGTTDEDKNIEAIEIKLNNTKDYSIKYRAYIDGDGWQTWKSNGELAGTNGEGKAIKAIEIKVEKTEIEEDENTLPEGIIYQTHVQDVGWQEWKSNGEMSGTSGYGRRLEGIKIQLNNILPGANILYRTHVQDIGWQAWKSNGELSGTSGEAKRLEGIEIKLENAPGYSVEYRVHVQGIGWQGWKSDGEMAGTSGEAKRLEGIEIKIVQKNAGVEYRTHVQDVGWQEWKSNGEMSGTSGYGRRLEGIEIKLTDAPAGANIVYRTHVQDVGWQDWKSNGEMSGTSGYGRRLEGIEIKLENAPGYSIQYRVHVQDVGWQDWKSDGEMAGTSGYGRRLEGIEIKLVKK